MSSEFSSQETTQDIPQTNGKHLDTTVLNEKEKEFFKQIDSMGHQIAIHAEDFKRKAEACYIEKKPKMLHLVEKSRERVEQSQPWPTIVLSFGLGFWIAKQIFGSSHKDI